MSGMTTVWFLGMAMGGAYAMSADCAIAQITPDGTLPNNSIVTPDGSTLNITGGTQAGGNLFHSFQEFSVLNGGTAFFNNAVDIQNIISRVTGGSVSNIDGLIRANGAANLFLINPNGIIFGRNAQLNIGGSFVATTANAIQFSNQGFFSASAPNSPELLTVNPSAFFFNQIAAAPIQNNSLIYGLRVPNGKSLLLVGGDINMNSGGLFALGGQVGLGGLAGAGTIGLNGDGNNLSLNFPNNVERSNVSLSNGAGVNVTAGDGGSIAVNARNLEMTGRSFLFAGIERRLGSDSSKAGNIEVNATGVINLNNRSSIANQVRAEANGQGGDVSISASTLQVEGGAEVNATTFSGGKGGNLTVDAQNVQLIGTSTNGRFASSLSASAQPNSTGNAGNMTLKTNTLLVRDGAVVSASTFGSGNGGNLTVDALDVQLIGTSADGQFGSGLFTNAERNSTGDAGGLNVKTNTLLVKDGAVVSASTFGSGNGGNLSVDALDVQLIGIRVNGQLVRVSGLFANANRNSTGNAGDLNVKTNTLLVQDGAQVITGTFSSGKGGNLSVDAQDVQLISRQSTDGRFTSVLAAGAAQNSTGNAGDLNVKTNTLLVRDGAQVTADTFGSGNGGNLSVDALDVQLIGESADGRVGSGLTASANRNSTGNAGDLTIKTNTLLVKDGAQVGVGTFSSGNSGNLTVDALDVQLIGTKANGLLASGVYTSAQRNSTGDAGDLIIKTNTLLVRDGAQVSASTHGLGKGGNLRVDAQDVQLIGRSADGQFGSGVYADAQLNSTGDAGNLTIKTNTLLVKDGAGANTNTFGSGKGGNLSVDAQDVQLIGRSADGRVGSGLRASAQQNSTGDAGDLTIKTNTLLVRDGAAVTVESFGTGTAGNMTVNARSIRLNNNALLTANTQSAKVDPNREQATININSRDLIMRRGSNIRTNAFGENVIGGNINIDTDFLIAFENSDISANSANFRGGNVRINASGIFGTQFRDVPSDKTSDITATGVSREFSGNVELNVPDVDLNSGLVNLPAVPIDTELAQGCYSPGYAQSSFIITGRGGFPPNPKDVLSPDAVEVDWVTLDPDTDNRKIPSVSTRTINPTPERIVEATGWVRNAKGEVEFIVNAPTTAPSGSWQTPINCSASKTGS